MAGPGGVRSLTRRSSGGGRLNEWRVRPTTRPLARPRPRPVREPGAASGRVRAGRGGLISGLPRSTSALALLLLLPCVACGTTEPTLNDRLDHAHLTLASGDRQADTVRAVLPRPIVVRLVGLNREPIENASVEFAAEGRCAEPMWDTTRTDSLAFASTRVRLGTHDGPCTLTARAVRPDGRIADIIRAGAHVRPGRPVRGWIQPGETISRFRPLRVPPPGGIWDRFSNGLLWDFEDPTGVVRLEGHEVSAIGTGTGTVDVVTRRYGLFAELAVRVCEVGDRLMIRLFWPTEEEPTRSCPS